MTTNVAKHERRPQTPMLERPLKPLGEAVPVSQRPFCTDWSASVGTFRNERQDCANPKPNEDRVTLAPDRGLVVLADGITRTLDSHGRYPDPSPSAAAADLFCMTVANLVRNTPEISLEVLKSIVAKGNEEIGRFNRLRFPEFDFTTRDRAGVAAVIGILEGNSLFLASIADCWCVGFKDGEPQRFAWEKTSHSRSEYVRLGESAAREKLRNKPANPLSYGAFTGEPESLHFVEYRQVALDKVSRLVFASDGLLRIAQEDPNSLKTMTAGELIRYGRILDHTNNETDDKTVVLLDRR